MVVPEGLGGRYELRGLLGRGGMADVREGWDRRLDRPVAIKLPRPELSTQTDIRLRFEAEAKAAATLNHPHVVAVYDSGEDNGVPYIVREHLPGHSMAEDIATGPIPVERVRTILIEVLDALAAAHSGGILHRDIKPANILFSTTGAVKVSDFGIAKNTHTARDITSYTVAGHIVGTRAYLSPQRLTRQPATVTDDLYAVADPGSGVELVAESTDGEQMHRGGGIGLDLGAQPLDVHVEGFRVPHVVAAPHPVDELPAAQHPARVAHQVFQEVELLERQRHRTTSHDDGVPLDIQAYRSRLEHPSSPIPV